MPSWGMISRPFDELLGFNVYTMKDILVENRRCQGYRANQTGIATGILSAIQESGILPLQLQKQLTLAMKLLGT